MPATHALTLTAASNSSHGTPLGCVSNAFVRTNAVTFTIGCWVKFVSTPGGGLQAVMGKWDSGAESTQEYLIYASGGNLHFVAQGATGGSGQFALLDAPGIVGGTWYFVVGIVDLSINTGYIYINGTQIASGLGPGGVFSTTVDFRIGSAVADSTWALDGLVAMAFKYTGRVSDANITFLYNGGNGRSTAEILAQTGLTTPDFLYGFDDATSTATLGTDSSTHATALTLPSGITTAPTQGTGPGPTLPTAGTLTGPTTGTTGSASSAFNITLDVAAPSGGTAIALSGGGSGTYAGTNISGTTLTIPSGQTGTGSVGNFTYNKATNGAQAITPTASGIVFTPTSITYTASGGAATGFAFSGPSSGYVNNTSTNFTITPNGVYTGTITITPSGGGLSTPIVKTFSSSATPQTFTITPTSSGTVTLTPTNAGSITNPSALSYTANAQTLAASPPSIPASTATTVTFTEAGGKFNTTPPTIGTSGVSGMTVGSVTVIDDTHATIPITAGSATGTVTYTDTSVAAHPTATQTVASGITTYRTTVIGFPSGLIGGTTAGFGIKISTDLGAYGSLLTDLISERSAGSYGRMFTVASTSIPDVRWFDGSGRDVLDANPVAVSAFPSRLPPNSIYKDSFAADTKLDGTCPSTSTATTMPFDPADARTNAMSGSVNQMLEIVGGTGLGQVIPIATVTGSSGSKVGTVLVGSTIFPTLDATSQYAWCGIPISSLPPSARVVSVSGTTIVVTGYPAGKNWDGQRLYHVPSGEIRGINSHSFSDPNYSLVLTAAFSSVVAGDSVCLLS